MFIPALLIIVKKWKYPKCSLTDEWMNKLCSAPRMEYQSENGCCNMDKP